jgi:hypothetical protein
LALSSLGSTSSSAQQPQGADFADARHAAEPLDLARQFGLTRREFGGGLLQSFDPLFEMANVGGQIRGDESVTIGRVGDGVEARLFARQFAPELDEPAAELLQGQHGVGGRPPGHELHALQELEDAERIEAIGLGSSQPRALKVFDRPRIDHHRFEPLRALQSERQAQAVNTGGFQTHASCGFAAGEQLEQPPMAGGRVGQGAGTFALAVAEDRHD